MRSIAGLLCALVLTTHACAWGPGAHEFLGLTAGEEAGFDPATRFAVASGSLLADLDHTLANAGVVGDSPAFARAMAEAHGTAPLSDRFTAGWIAHVLAQDPGQQEISSRNAKLDADMILTRVNGFPSGGAVFDPERIRAAATHLSGAAPSARDVTAAVEKLVLLSLVESAALDMLPLELDEPNGALPAARQLMPPELAFYERRMASSKAATLSILQATIAELTAHLPEGASPPARPADTIGLPPAALLGVSLKTRATAGGLMLTTARLSHPLLFRTAIRVVVHKLGARLFPTATAQWSEGSRVAAVTKALDEHLAKAATELEALFP